MLSDTAISLLNDICIEDARNYPDSAHPFWLALAENENICPSHNRLHEDPHSVTIFRYEEAL